MISFQGHLTTHTDAKLIDRRTVGEHFTRTLMQWFLAAHGSQRLSHRKRNSRISVAQIECTCLNPIAQKECHAYTNASQQEIILNHFQDSIVLTQLNLCSIEIQIVAEVKSSKLIQTSSYNIALWARHSSHQQNQCTYYAKRLWEITLLINLWESQRHTIGINSTLLVPLCKEYMYICNNPKCLLKALCHDIRAIFSKLVSHMT